MFVAQLSEDALTAVSLAFPIQTLMIAISSVPELVSMHCYLETLAKEL